MEKRSKTSVNYSLGGDHCGACKHFIEATEDEVTETADCEVVEGRVKEDYWCKLFKKRERSVQKFGTRAVQKTGAL